MRFTDRVAIVTGGSGVLGGASAKALAREGAKVALGYRRGKAVAEKNLKEIEAAGGTAHIGPLDVTDPASCKTFVAEAFRRFGRVDILVNAAGRIDAADAVRFDKIDLDAWDMLFRVDVKGTFLMCREVVPHMRTRGRGSIINFAGSFGNGVNQENLVNSVAVQYCAAKGAVRGFTAALARDLAPTIRVNAVSPGPIQANWDADWGIPAAHVKEALDMTPLKRMGQPEEMAQTVCFLASDGAGYITGQMILADGGWTLAG
jgi:3-oxoacyl-[acyl-carrier protein] reductase